ncbi:MAG: helix-turn-helix transcriptional regulator, partial [Proteobacteria bacterium]|nr:helix-turn-helix transcriptional regulator [Pseudomonadota bacterium]
MSRQEQKKKTKAAIIDAAQILFARKGIAGTSTADVAKACGVSHGTVFVHFKERDDLILAVIDAFGTQLSKAFDHALIGEKSVAGVLRAHLRTLAMFEDFYFRL